MNLTNTSFVPLAEWIGRLAVFCIFVVMKTTKIVLLVLWIGLLLFCLGYAIYNPGFFTAQGLQKFLEQFGGQMLLVYLLLSLIRGLALVPSTPLIVAGSLVFSDNLHLVLLISMLGVIFSATVVYFFSNFMGFDQFFQRRFPKQIQTVRNRLNHRYGFFYVLGWAFFPLVPTDIVCYVAGTIKMNFFKFLMALFVGEIILVAIYVYGSSYLFSWLI